MPRPPTLAVAALVLALCACAGSRAAGPLEPADPAQRIEGDATEAHAVVRGVELDVRLDQWRGRPPDLEQRLTPVEVAIRNGSGTSLRMFPEQFSLVSPGGARSRPLEPQDIRRALASLAKERNLPRTYTGAHGVYPWPGFGTPGARPYPFAASGPAAGAVPPPPVIPGSLRNGDALSLLLFFDVPAATLSQATFETDLVTDANEKLGTARLPFSRER